VEKCIDAAVADFQNQGHSVDSIKAIGITNQRETTVVWDSETGEPLYNAIVWTDTRTQGKESMNKRRVPCIRCTDKTALVRKIKRRLGQDQLQKLSGLNISTYPSAPKLLWLLENNPRVKDAYERRKLLFGTIDAWLVYKLNGGPGTNVFVTDPSNASRTMFMNIETLQYDESLIDFFRLDRNKIRLPEIVHSSDNKRYGSLASTVLKGVPIMGCLGDQSAALVGQKGFSPGKAKNTYGTGCFLLYNVGEKPVISTHGLLTTVAYDFGGKLSYALEGSIAVGGSSVKFLVDNFGFINASHEISALAETVEDNGGCVFVTAFSGLFAPYWIDDARGTIFGITTYTQRGHVSPSSLLI
jgi:glycerol kinase